ncbi:MAG: 4Fe-4S dicluster domain-containing protein, partial [Gemmataceae bacterium]|nr:4Fe-4S dicluster domain-containing protein [Gemmataceae bacterium]
HQQREYARLGLYQAQSLLVLDLERCTRCDECTRGCADSHPDRNARLLREGARFDKWLVTTCCRSCHKPYCLEGCPVDAIHRKGKGLQIVIESHCIGCSLCEKQCPYGAIQMADVKEGRTGERTAAVPQKAVNCDLCNGLDDPYCVRACPHDAAFRFTGEKLLETARKRP